MNHKLIDYIQTEVTSIAKSKYPNDQQLQWVYVYGFICAQLASACERDNFNIYRFKEAVAQVKSKD
jgi:hypothetical protein